MKRVFTKKNLKHFLMSGLILFAIFVIPAYVNAQNSQELITKSAMAQSAVSESDSLILVALYNATNGSVWTNNTNWLTGPVDTWFGVTLDADNVTELNLRENNLTGRIPAVLGQLSKLQVLDLDTNQISGSIPVELGQLADLESLHLSGNQLTGVIPSELGQLANLTSLYLNDNYLTGSIPVAFGDLSKLQYLYLNNNGLTGSIPAEIGQLSNLLLLYSNNNQLTGTIPAELGQLLNLKWFNLEQNQLSGIIPVDIQQFVDLEYLNIAQNQLTGSIPVGIKQLVKLRWLDLGNNHFSGSIPADIWDQPDLSMLYLEGNQLTGSIPYQLGQLTKLKWLNLSQNELTGSIPVELGQIDSLRLLFLNDNQLSGTIPAELGLPSKMEWINFNNNHLEGIIPIEIWNLQNLSQLYLSNNQLTDTIPGNIGQLSDLQWVALDNNAITGKLPSEISQLNRLKYLNVQINNLDSLPDLTIPDSLSEMYLANNKFTFEDFENNMDIVSPTLTFDYVPQDSIGENQSVSKYKGESYSYELVTGGTQNSYQWYKDGQPLASQTSAKLDFNSLVRSNSGKYFCEVTNSLVSDLTLSSRIISIEVIDTTETCIKLKFQAGWNIFSSPVLPDSTDIKLIFQPLIDNNSLIKIQDELGNSLENWGFFGGWQNNIGDINPSEGYRIKLSKADSLEVCGKQVDYPYPVSLQSGWNIIGFSELEEIDGMEVVQPLIDNSTLIKVQDELGNSIENWGFFGGWQNNIGNFLPGKGYRVKMISKDTLIYVESSFPKSAVVVKNAGATIHYVKCYEGNGVDHMNINLVNLPVNFIQPGDELAVFDGGNCVGAVTLTSSNLKSAIVSLIASSSDEPDLKGFVEGNPIILKYWSSEQNKEFVLETEVISGISLFQKNETTFASLEKYVTTGLGNILNENKAQIRIYPNPFDEELTIKLDLADNESVLIEIYNQLGQILNVVQPEKVFDSGVQYFNWNAKDSAGHRIKPGVYYVKIARDNNTTFNKIVYRYNQ